MDKPGMHYAKWSMPVTSYYILYYFINMKCPEQKSLYRDSGCLRLWRRNGVMGTGVIAKEYRVLFWGNECVLESTMVIIAHIRGYTKSYWIVNLKFFNVKN